MTLATSTLVQLPHRAKTMEGMMLEFSLEAHGRIFLAVSSSKMLFLWLWPEQPRLDRLKIALLSQVKVQLLLHRHLFFSSVFCTSCGGKFK